MSKKIIQLSTKQCPPCQKLRQEIESIIDKTPYTYKYISLYNGVEKDDPSFTYKKYWDEIEDNINIYRKKYKVNFYSFPTIIKEEDGKFELIPKDKILNILENESK
jgi:hypothetical protein